MLFCILTFKKEISRYIYMWWFFNQSKEQEEEQKEERKKRYDDERTKKQALYKKLIEFMDNKPEIVKKILAIYTLSTIYEAHDHIHDLLINNNFYDNIDEKKEL
jgi:esterase/lipase